MSSPIQADQPVPVPVPVPQPALSQAFVDETAKESYPNLTISNHNKPTMRRKIVIYSKLAFIATFTVASSIS